MKDKISVLLVGEATIVADGAIKGFEYTIGVVYDEQYLIMKDMIESLGHEFHHIPGHLIGSKFPRSLDELKRYDVILLSDIGSDSFLLIPEVRNCHRSVNLIKLIRDFVSEGGGLGMIGGYSTFQGFMCKGNWKDTAVEEVLPVELLSRDDRVEMPEGADIVIDPGCHEILNGLPLEWPYILGYNRLIAKPGATVIVEFEKDPIITLGTYGKGHSIAYATDCTSHWAPPAMTEWEYYPVLWDRIIKYLAGR